MNVDSFLLSDYADVINGKLVVVGTFDSIAGKKFPAVHPLIAVSIVIHAHPSEAGRSFEIELRIIGEDRKPIVPTTKIVATLPEKTPPPGLPLRVTVAGRILFVKFPKPGPYAVEAYIDGTYHAAAALYVTGPGS